MTQPLILESDADLQKGMAALCAASPHWAALCARTGCPPLRRRAGGFEGLARIIVAQQVSVASAAAIWERTARQFAPMTAATILAADDAAFRMAGLSRPKQRSLRAIAAAITDGSLDLETLHLHEAGQVHARMTHVSGIGPWTADVYMLFCLGHIDAFAPGDLALQEAARLTFGLDRRPTAKELAVLAENWRPWRGVAARLLWADYALAKTRASLPV